MGSKGSKPQTTQQTQTTTPNPYVAGAGQQAIQGAEYAAGQPFQMPVAPLAPFSPFENQAFGATQQAMGMAQPYFGAGSEYLMGSAAPVTGQDVAGYYNPMAQNVMAGMQDVFGQQMAQATRGAVQQAGGIGADRVAVAQANLAKQQGLAAGQTMAGLYYPALQAAQQQKQMMAGAGYGLGQMGPAAQSAQLQSIQSMLAAGGMQRQMGQNYLNALYQNRLAQIGYPFQTPQYLAGIAGGLGPAMGGTTQGQSQTWAAQPSALSQALGVGTSLLGMGLAPFTGGASLGLSGLGGMMGGGKGSQIGPTFAGGGMGMMGGVPFPIFKDGGKVVDLDKDEYSYADGGEVPRYPVHMKGGGTPPPLPPPPAPVINPQPIGQSATVDPHIAMGTGEAIAEADPFFQWYGGVPDVVKSQIARMTPPVQLASAQPASIPASHAVARRAHGADDLRNMFEQWYQERRAQEMSPQTGAQYSAAGGAVGPEDVGQGFQFGGDVVPGTDPFGVGNPLLYGDYPAQPKLGLGDIGAAAQAKGYRSPIDVIAPAPQESKWNVQNWLPGGRESAAAKPTPTAGIEQPANVPLPMGRPTTASISDPSAELPQIYKGTHDDLSQTYGPKVASAVLGNLGVESPNLDPTESHDQGTGIGIAGWRLDRREALMDFAKKNGRDPYDRRTQLDFLKDEIQTNPQYADMIKRMQAAPTAAAASRIFRTEFERPAGTTQGMPLGANRAAQLASQFERGNFNVAGQPMGPREESPFPMAAGARDFFLPREQQPYPDALDRDWGQRMVRSPWMSLVKAGAAMAQTPGPIGSVIGKGIEAGVGELEGQRKSLRSEEELNLKADALYKQAQVHLDDYQRKSMYADMRLELAKEKEERIRQRQDEGSIRPPSIDAIAKEVYATPEWSVGKKPEEVRDEINRRYKERLDLWRQGRSGALESTTPGDSKANPVDDPGEGKRQPGKWYRLKDGSVKQWG